MSFFIRKQGRNTKQKGRPTTSGQSKEPWKELSNGAAKKLKRKRSKLELEVESDSDDAGEEEFAAASSDEDETAQDKRIRLERKYLAQLEAEEAEKGAGEDDQRGAVAHRLHQEALEQAGKLHNLVADQYIAPEADSIRYLKSGHKLPLTCLALSTDGRFCYTASKDCCIVKWDVKEGKKLRTVPGGRKGTEDKHIGHTATVLCLALSTDNKFLASGDCNNLIYIWNAETMGRVHVFKGHRGPVSGVAFRRDSHQLFSGSGDRCLKVWSVDDLAYVETLFGHQDGITAVDSMSRERAISAGGRDGSLRIWKVVEESQLLFHGHRGSIDCVTLINEEYFFSGADDNSVALWTVRKKRPLVTVKAAHSIDDAKGVTQGDSRQNWISAVASLKHSDLLASGSKDGCIRLWKCSEDFKTLSPVFSIPVAGFVNGLAFSADGSVLVAAVGQEHRLGRWWRVPGAKNALLVIPLSKKQSS